MKAIKGKDMPDCQRQTKKWLAACNKIHVIALFSLLVFHYWHLCVFVSICSVLFSCVWPHKRDNPTWTFGASSCGMGKAASSSDRN